MVSWLLFVVEGYIALCFDDIYTLGVFPPYPDVGGSRAHAVWDTLPCHLLSTRNIQVVIRFKHQELDYRLQIVFNSISI